MIALGIDLGSSSVKVSLFHIVKSEVIGSGSYPDSEMHITSPKPGFAEQNAEIWWDAFLNAYKRAIKNSGVDPNHISSIGISYQMHGLVCLDKAGNVVRPPIIWCDSRAVNIGREALQNIGEEYALNSLLNSPGNFTASKLKWVKDNEPALYEKIDKICLPGDYIGYRLTGQLTTTITGLSEGIFYDFKTNNISNEIMDYFGFESQLIPEIKSSFDFHGSLSKSISKKLGIPQSAAIFYKAGDQPNNAFSLGILEPGQFATTAGTSGVIYGVSKDLFSDPDQRVNSFAHVNYLSEQPRIGVLLCINGTGISYAWARKWTGVGSYKTMDEMASNIHPGSMGLLFHPFGNGSERMLGERAPGAGLTGLNYTIHNTAHLYRSILEGIAFAFNYGKNIFTSNGLEVVHLKAGNANMYASPIFCQIIANVLDRPIEIYNTDGSAGAARGAAYGAGEYSIAHLFQNLNCTNSYEPYGPDNGTYKELYDRWKSKLERLLLK